MRTFAIFLCLFFPLYGAMSPDAVKRRMIADLNFVKSCFEVRYAPVQWKQKYVNWNLDAEVEHAKQRIESLNNPTIKNFRYILRDLFASACDYHVGIRFQSTEEAYLPFLIKGAAGRYFFVHIDRNLLPLSNFPFQVGDEILTFGGVPIHEAITNLCANEIGHNTPQTDQELAELLLTKRKMSDGNFVPSGMIVITGKDKKTKVIRKATLKWYYTPEKIRDFANLGKSPQASLSHSDKKCNNPFKMMMVAAHLSDQTYQTSKYSIGARESFIPQLGPKLWSTSSSSSFHAYIFSTPKGALIGYIRIPHYSNSTEEAEEFGKIISMFQSTTDALVIDQINNPGGSLFYSYGLASMLTNYPLEAPKQYMSLTQSEVQKFLEILEHLDSINQNDPNDEEWLLFNEWFDGFQVDVEFIEDAKQFCRFVINQWNQGNLYTDPTYLLGVKYIKPHSQYVYTKPILLLTNGLVFSGGDFFAAIMQDNGRAAILGERTAGAGGYVHRTTFPNQTGIESFNLTASLAERVNGEPLENLGVQPDIPYTITVDDLQNNYRDYVAEILQAVEELIRS